MTSPYSLVIFDCDGVLVSTGPVEPDVRDLLLREQGIITDKAALTRDLYGMTNEQIWAFLETTYGIEITPAFAERYISECHTAFETSTTAIDGSPEVVALVRSAGIPFCVASNGPHEQMQVTLRVTGHMPHFEGAIFSAYDVPSPKPAPDLFLHAARTMGFDPAVCAVIEDGPGGVQAGVAAGMQVFQYMGGGMTAAIEHPRVTTFSRMAELPRLLGLG